jgi:pimeloyl-ACP methyl ester carboxylesterase
MATIRQVLPFNSTIVRIMNEFSATRLFMPVASAIAPAWTAKTLARRFITPPRIAHTGKELAALQNGTRVNINTPEGQIAAWHFGARHAPAVIMSHGWGGRGAQFREFVAPFIDCGYQVWFFDHVSHGFSQGQEAPITAFAKGVAAVVRHVESRGTAIAGLVGHSLGCAGIGIALRHDLAHLRDVRVVQIAPPASLIRYSHFFARTMGIPERIRDAMQWRLEQKIGVRWNEFEMPRAAASLTAKALVIHDQSDREVRIENGLAVARAWPDARFKRTFGLGHRRVLRDPHVIGATLDFIADRVEFSPPPQPDEWSQTFASLSGPAPLY